jgi:hypothetical protein
MHRLVYDGALQLFDVHVVDRVACQINIVVRAAEWLVVRTCFIIIMLYYNALRVFINVLYTNIDICISLICPHSLPRRIEPPPWESNMTWERFIELQRCSTRTSCARARRLRSDGRQAGSIFGSNGRTAAKQALAAALGRELCSFNCPFAGASSAATRAIIM